MSTEKGKVKVKSDTVQVSEKFKKREFVITTDGQYPQDVIFQLSKDNCALLDNINVGDEVTVHYNLRGREWINPQGEAKYFNTLEAWKIDVNSATYVAPVQQAQTLPKSDVVAEEDTLPF